MATVSPEISVKIKFDTPTLQSELAAAEGLILKSTEVTEAKILSSDKLHQQKLAQQREMAFNRYETSREIAEKRALDRSLKAQTSWSAKMTKNLESLTMTVKGFFAAWAVAQLGSIARDSLRVAGGMREMADGLQISTQEYFALSSAMRDAGVEATKLDVIFARINDMVSGGATDKQRGVLNALGINTEGMSNIRLFDELLRGVNDRVIKQSDLIELLGNRSVVAFNRLSAEINNVNDATDRYKFPLTEAQVATLDAANMQWEITIENLKLAAAQLFVILSGTEAYQDRIQAKFNKMFDESYARLRQARMGVDIPEEMTRRFRQPIVRTPQPAVTQIGRATPAPDFIPSFAQGQAMAGLDAAMDSTRRMNQAILDADVATKQWASSFEEIPKTAKEAETSLIQVQQTMGAVANAISGVFSMQSMLFQNEIAHLQAVEDRERERWEERSKMLVDAGLQSSALYKREQQAYEKAQKDRQKKQLKLQSKAWETEKTARIGTITMDIASAIMKAWATTVPTWLAPATAALASASGAVQMGIVASQQNPYKGFAIGGLVKGRGFADEIPIRTTPGEFVSTRESTEKNLGALEFGNRGGKIGQGGGITIIVQGDIIGDQRYVESKLIPNLQKALDRGHRLRMR